MDPADEAEERWRQILVEQPENAEAARELGRLLSARAYALQGRGELPASVECYEEALALDPSQARAHNNLGNAYQALGRPHDAVAHFRSAIEVDDSLAEAHLNLGMALYHAGELGAAEASYRSALQRKGDFAEAHLNLGYLLGERGDWLGATDAYRQAISAKPELAEARFNYALQLLQSGDFARGWEEYEWRLRLPDLAPYWPHAGRARWDGSDLKGRRLLLHAEQGFGDALQFVRYVPMVAERHGPVILSCSPKLLELFAGISGVSEFHNAESPAPAFDVCCSLLSLPRLFRTAAGSIPAPVPYLRAPADKAARWRERLASSGAARKVGLCWSSDSRSRTTPLRSLGLSALAPLARASGAVFYSLQVGSAAAQAARPPDGMTLVDTTADLKDFSDTAALVANLDLVISIDTAVAHLAGALGKPVWTLLQYPCDWRWQRDRDDSPWYPTMRLFRTGPGEGVTELAARLSDALCRSASPG